MEEQSSVPAGAYPDPSSLLWVGSALSSLLQSVSQIERAAVGEVDNFTSVRLGLTDAKCNWGSFVDAPAAVIDASTRDGFSASRNIGAKGVEGCVTYAFDDVMELLLYFDNPMLSSIKSGMWFQPKGSSIDWDVLQQDQGPPDGSAVYLNYRCGVVTGKNAGNSVNTMVSRYYVYLTDQQSDMAASA